MSYIVQLGAFRKLKDSIGVDRIALNSLITALANANRMEEAESQLHRAANLAQKQGIHFSPLVALSTDFRWLCQHFRNTKSPAPSSSMIIKSSGVDCRSKCTLCDLFILALQARCDCCIMFGIQG